MNTRAISIVPVRRAFTLVEMLVSLVVIIIVLAIVTNVFAIATKTTQTAQAITDVQTQLDGIVRELEADFSGVKPERSVLMIYGRTQAAALTEADRQANKYYRFLTGDPSLANTNNFDPARDPIPANPAAADGAAQFSDPRADLMMFFTERPSTTAVPVETGASANAFQRSLAFGARGTPVQVVYGHAAIASARPQFSGSDVTDYQLDQVKHIEQIRLNQNNQDRRQRSVLPLSDWVVARRALIVEPILPASSNASAVAATRRIPQSYFEGNNDPLASVMVQSRPMEGVSLAYADMAGQSDRSPDSIPFDMISFLRILDPTPAYDSGTLRSGDRISDVSSYFGHRSPEPSTVRRSRVAQASPYRWRTQGATFSPNVIGGAPWQKFSNVNGIVDIDPVLDAFFPAEGLVLAPDAVEARAFRHFATAIMEPPASLRGNLNFQQLRACAWFQVEVLIPEDPRNSWDHPDGQARAAMPRWVSVPDGDYFVFVPDSRDNRIQIETQLPSPGQPNRWRAAQPNSRLQQFGTITPLPNGKDEDEGDRRVRTWPYAIRVTMKMFDAKGVLKDPITRTYEHWFD